MIKEHKIGTPIHDEGLTLCSVILAETIEAAEVYMLRGFMYSVFGQHGHASGCYLKAAKKVRSGKAMVARDRFWGFRH